MQYNNLPIDNSGKNKPEMIPYWGWEDEIAIAIENNPYSEQIENAIKNNSAEQFLQLVENLKLASKDIEILFRMICSRARKLIEVSKSLSKYQKKNPNIGIDPRILLFLIEQGLESRIILSVFPFFDVRSNSRTLIPNLRIFNSSYTSYHNQEDCSFLHLLCASSKINEVNSRALLENLDYTTEQDYYFRQTPLHYALTNPHITQDTLNILLKKIRGFDLTDVIGRTPLHLACEQATPDIILTLLDHDVDVNFVNQLTGTTPLHIYCQRENIFLVHSYYQDKNKRSIYCNRANLDLDVLKTLLEKGAETNVRDEFGKGSTPLHYICQAPKINWKAFKLLIEHGADILQKDKKGKTPLDYIPKNILENWLRKNLHKKDRKSRTLLHLSCMNDKIDLNTLGFLLRQGLDIHAVDKYGKTCLHYLSESALREHKLTLFLLYVEKPEDLTVRDKENLTPLHIAYLNANLLAANRLMQQSTNPVDFAGSSNGMIIDTVLLQAAIQGNKDLVESVLTQGAHIDARNQTGSTALFLACHYGHAALVQFLLSKNANINLANQFDSTPKEAALNEEISQLLLQHEERAATKVSATIKGFLQRHRYAKQRVEHEEKLNEESVELICSLRSQKRYKEVRKIAEAFKHNHLHAIKKILTNKPEKEFELESGFKVKY